MRSEKGAKKKKGYMGLKKREKGKKEKDRTLARNVTCFHFFK